MTNLFQFPAMTTLVLIGGGDTMVHVARRALALRIGTRVILSTRHAQETLPLGGTNTETTLRGLGLSVSVIDDVNAWPELDRQPWNPESTVALCFGPAWVFKSHVMARFGGMANYNPIPIPRYLGGAHYTWQIMNGDRSGGCILQLITDRLDKGPILDAVYFDLPDSARVPEDYFAAYTKAGNRLMTAAVEKIAANAQFEAIDYETVNPKRLYLPRLLTAHNAYIDWNWDGLEVERFCCAFDRPYMGAGTFIDGSEVRLSDVWYEPGESFHPFLSGMIVRRVGGQVCVAVRGGLLRIGRAHTRGGVDALPLLKEGRRLATPPQELFEAMTYRPQLSGKNVS